MKTKKKDLNEIIRKIQSPYRNIADQLKFCKEVKELFKNNTCLDKYNLSKMMPKVSYDEWMVCLYEDDNKFYYFDEDGIMEVEPIMIFHCDEKYKTYFDNNGKAIINTDQIENYIPCSYLCCGESDDLNKWIVFKSIEKAA